MTVWKRVEDVSCWVHYIWPYRLLCRLGVHYTMYGAPRCKTCGKPRA